MNERPDRILLRAALRMHASLSGYHRRLPAVTLPEWSWTECVNLQRKLEMARSRRWNGAEGRLRQRLETTLRCLLTEIDRQSQVLTAAATRPAVAPVSEIVRDLAALDGEFDGFRIDLRERTVTVETEPIVLEDVNLGRFRIRLEWSRCDNLPDYSVLAVDPRYLDGDDAVTHPHVENGYLCEGDGKAAIRVALESGRLFDFFVLVRQILQTYNASSAYVTLSEWDGGSCSDCGGSVSDDEALHCQNCESLLCGECCRGCGTCGEGCCYGCLFRCGDCEQQICRACLNRCPVCRGDYCAECIDAEEPGRCRACRAAEHKPAGEPGPPAGPKAVPAAREPAGAAVPSDGLGQAAVPA